ncbi:MAG: hypothetical protein NVS3B15_01260 [Sediminibacterium sp.]
MFSVSSLAQTAKPQASLNHVALYVRDLRTSSAFYENVIELDTVPEPFHDGKHTWLSIGPHMMMHIIEGAPALRNYYKNNHICFSVPSLDAFVEKLRKNNLNWEDRDGKQHAVTNRVDGVKQLWLQDPDGYWVEVNDDKF